MRVQEEVSAEKAFTDEERPCHSNWADWGTREGEKNNSPKMSNGWITRDFSSRGRHTAVFRIKANLAWIPGRHALNMPATCFL